MLFVLCVLWCWAGCVQWVSRAFLLKIAGWTQCHETPSMAGLSLPTMSWAVFALCTCWCFICLLTEVVSLRACSRVSVLVGNLGFLPLIRPDTQSVTQTRGEINLLQCCSSHQLEQKWTSQLIFWCRYSPVQGQFMYLSLESCFSQVDRERTGGCYLHLNKLALCLPMVVRQGDKEEKKVHIET